MSRCSALHRTSEVQVTECLSICYLVFVLILLLTVLGWRSSPSGNLHSLRDRTCLGWERERNPNSPVPPLPPTPLPPPSSGRVGWRKEMQVPAGSSTGAACGRWTGRRMSAHGCRPGPRRLPARLARGGCRHGRPAAAAGPARGGCQHGWPAAAAGMAGPRRLPARPARGGCWHARGGCSKMDPKMPEQ
jgi:hypothetical protein